MHAGTVSVIMPAFNTARYIHAAALSILEQSHEDIELIVVDDHSIDGTVEALAGLRRDDRMRVLTTVGKGAAAARNTGLSAATGSFVMWQDSDDLADPARTERLLEALAPGDGFSHSDMAIIDGDGVPGGVVSCRQVQQDAYLPQLLRHGNSIFYGSVLARAETVKDLRFREHLTIGEDMDFARRFATRWKGRHVAEPLYLYRRHGANATRTLTIDMLRGEMHQLLEDEALEDLAPEAFASFACPDSIPIAEALVARKLAARGFEEEALEWFARATAKTVSDNGRQVITALLSLASGRPHDVPFDLQGERSNPVELVLLGDAQLELGRREEASSRYFLALQALPNYYDARYGYARAARELADPSLMNIFGAR